MAGEIQAQHVTGATLYAVLLDATSGLWNGAAFDTTPTAGEWSSYPITMTEYASMGYYRGAMPAASAGYYSYRVHRQAGGSPATTDPVVWTGEGQWSGTAWVYQAGDSFTRIGAAGAGLTAVGDTAGTTTLLSRLSATRAGYLDNLSAGAVALASAVSTLQTDVTTLLSRVTGAVALATSTTAAAIRSALGLASANLDTQLDALPTAAETADAVWDEALSGHAAAGSAGTALSAAGSASDPLLNTVPGSYASGTAGHALGRISTGQITTVSTVTPEGDITEIIGGADYSATDGRSFDWTEDSDAPVAWPVLTGATVVWHGVAAGGSVDSFGMSVVTATGSAKKVRLELTDTDTLALEAAHVGAWQFYVWATLSSGRVVELVRGTAPVISAPGP